jgi:hypothetical protein
MIYEWTCLNGHEKETVSAVVERDVQSPLCKCGHLMSRIISRTRTNLYFEEGRTRTIANLNTLDEHGNEVPCPPLSSWKDYEKQKKKAGVAEAGSRQGTKGVWI